MNRRDLMLLSPALLLAGCEKKEPDVTALTAERFKKSHKPGANAKAPSDDLAVLEGCALFIMLSSLYVPKSSSQTAYDNDHVDQVLAKYDSTNLMKPYLPSQYYVSDTELTPKYKGAYDNVHKWIQGLNDTERNKLKIDLLTVLDVLTQFVRAASLQPTYEYPEGNPDNCLGLQTAENLAHYGVLTPKATPHAALKPAGGAA